MAKFRSRPKEVEAMQFPGNAVGKLTEMVAFDDWLATIEEGAKCRYVGGDLHVPTMFGILPAEPGEWVVKLPGDEGLIVLPPKDFAELYTPVEQENSAP